MGWIANAPELAGIVTWPPFLFPQSCAIVKERNENDSTEYRPMLGIYSNPSPLGIDRPQRLILALPTTAC